MEYTIEELSPVKKKVNIQVPSEEVDAALGSALAIWQKQVEMPGFRKGKVPASVIDKTYHAKIDKEARENLINVHINDIVQKADLTPVSPIRMQGEDKPLIKGQPFEYSMEFEVMPAFDLPSYEGLEATQKSSKPTEEDIDSLINRYRDERIKLVPASGTEAAKDGQVVNIDFETIVDDKTMPDFSTTNFDLELGGNKALPQFEALIKTIPPGHTGEGEVTFPEDFLAKELAGKTATMKVTVHAIKDKDIPVADDAFAKANGFTDLENMRNTMGKAYERGMEKLHKAETQNELLAKLLKQTDFPLPEAVVRMESNLILNDYIERMERMGKNPLHGHESIEKLQESLRSEAEERARQKILLLAIAKKENLSVSQQEIYDALYQSSQKLGINFQDYMEKMEATGLIFQFRDNMLCDKAIDLVYERAKIQMTDERDQEERDAVQEADQGA